MKMKMEMEVEMKAEIDMEFDIVRKWRYRQLETHQCNEIYENTWLTALQPK